MICVCVPDYGQPCVKNEMKVKEEAYREGEGLVVLQPVLGNQGLGVHRVQAVLHLHVLPQAHLHRPQGNQVTVPPGDRSVSSQCYEVKGHSVHSAMR